MPTYTVLNTNDTGAGSLRQAIDDANLSSGSDIIEFDNALIGGTINLGSTLLVDDTLTWDGDINNNGMSDVTVVNFQDQSIFELQVGGMSFTNNSVNMIYDASATSNSIGVAIRMTGGNQTFVNNADLDVTGALGFAGDRSTGIFIDGQSQTFVNSGDITVAGRFAVNASSFNAVDSLRLTTITNTGLMEGTDDAIRLTSGTIYNSGTIRSTNTFAFPGQTPGEISEGITLLGSYEAGFTHSSGGVATINNLVGGFIEGSRAGVGMSGGGELNNDGSIFGNTTGVWTQRAFDENGDVLSTTFTVNNTGSINSGAGTTGFLPGTPPATILINDGHTANTINNSGNINGAGISIYARAGTTLTNTATGLIQSDNDTSGGDKIAFRGATFTDFQVEVSIGFPALSSNDTLVTTQDVSIDVNGDWVINGVGTFSPPPGGQVESGFLTNVGAGVLIPLIDITATQNAGYIVFQTDANGVVFPATQQVTNDGTLFGDLTVDWVSGSGFTVTDGQFPVYNPPSSNFNDVITNDGNMIGDIQTGLGDDVVTQNGTLDGDIDLGRGNDVLTLGAGATATINSIQGGMGNDVFNLTDDSYGFSLFRGNAGYDVATITSASEMFLGVVGNADNVNGIFVFGQNGQTYILDEFEEASQFDSVSGFVQNKFKSGTTGDDTMDVSTFNLDTDGVFTVVGGLGNDTLTAVGVDAAGLFLGGSGMDTLTGGNGNDNFNGGDGADIMDGGTGNDIFNFDSTDTGVDFVTGGDGTDFASFVGYGFAIWVDLDAASGAEVYHRNGQDVSSGTWTAVTNLVSVESIGTTQFSDVIFGSAADNSFSYVNNIGGFDRFDGRGGSDTVDFNQAQSAIWVDMQFNGIEAWTRGGINLNSGTWDTIANFVSIENVVATSFQDQIQGNASDNTFSYTVNNAGANAFDRYDGRAGIDTADFGRSNFAVWVDLGFTGIEAWTRGNTNVASGTWDQIANLENFENITGSEYEDQLFGDNGDNVINGGNSADQLTGRGGVDTFVFEGDFGFDEVMDFQDGTDLLDFSDFGIGIADLTIVDNGVGGTTITYNGFDVTLTGVDVSLIDAADFVF